MSIWKLTAHAPRRTVEQALHTLGSLDDWDPDLTVSGREVDEDRPHDWVLEAWYPCRPAKAVKAALSALFDGETPAFSIEKLAEQDWLALSQRGVEPIRAGPFHVRTPDFPAQLDAIDLVIPAAQAFGTGHHHTTAGCLEMLAAMKANGLHPRAIADIGTGTGLLAIAARELWPAAFITASDIDPVCFDVVAENARVNDVPLGPGRGKMTMVTAPGMANELLALRGPYDLLIANILALPLIDLADDFARAVAPGGSVLLAGMLAGEQERAVRRAYRRSGFRSVANLIRGDWAIVWMRRRRGWRASA